VAQIKNSASGQADEGKTRTGLFVPDVADTMNGLALAFTA
jgi:hypothetical protein